MSEMQNELTGTEPKVGDRVTIVNGPSWAYEIAAIRGETLYLRGLPFGAVGRAVSVNNRGYRVTSLGRRLMTLVPESSYREPVRLEIVSHDPLDHLAEEAHQANHMTVDDSPVEVPVEEVWEKHQKAIQQMAKEQQ